MRVYFKQLHRWLSLIIIPFLFIECITGCVALYRNQIDSWLNPDLFISKEPSSLTLTDLIYNLEKQSPHSTLLTVTRIPPPGQNGRALSLSKDSIMNELFYNIRTGKIIGKRPLNGTLTKQGIIPLLYRLHYSLAYNEKGTFLLGLIAIIWFISSFFGVLLSLPCSYYPWEKKFWKRWLPLWKIKRYKTLKTVIYDLHRIPALWLFLILIIFSISSIAMSLGESFYQPLIRSIFPSAPSLHCSLKTLSKPLSIDMSENLALSCAKTYGLTTLPNNVFFLDHKNKMIFYNFGKNGAPPTGLNHGVISINRHEGQALFLSLPSQKRELADTLIEVMPQIHNGRIVNKIGPFLTFILGIIIIILCLTGSYISLLKYISWIKNN